MPATKPEPVGAAPPRPKPGERFLRGPIPRDWLAVAMRLPGKTLHVSLELWYRAGLTGRAEVALSLTKIAQAGGFDRATASRALEALSDAGLVTVQRAAGRAPRVTILPVVREVAPRDQDD